MTNAYEEDSKVGKAERQLNKGLEDQSLLGLTRPAIVMMIAVNIIITIILIIFIICIIFL